MFQVLVLHGPNLDLQGEREPSVYGSMSLEEINQRLIETGKDLGLEIRCMQSNHEGALIEALHEARRWARGIVFNPAGYSHTSVALRDAVSALPLPVVEVHLTNIHAREDFRRISLIAPVCAGQIVGLGWRSYQLGLRAIAEILADGGKTP